MKWHPTPEEERVKAVRLIGSDWVTCELSEIRRGDVFRTLDPDDGKPIHPIDLSPDPDVVALATADAIKMDPAGRHGQWYGWGVEIDVFGSMDHFKRSGAN